jgi:hypothetical protein
MLAGLQFELTAFTHMPHLTAFIEREELDAFVTANTMLMILKSKARRSLVKQPSAA